ncbi:hypothetical protein BC833DRAFT_116955 [Globomyces pollinis-pini]|nr:hypothetical protein BC833DRAFT_116955 [Globomyces pollinis-pini]
MSDCSSRTSAYYTDAGFSFPMPINEGELILNKQKDFDIPMDLKLLVELSGGVGGIRRKHDVSTPSQFVNISKNIFVDRKPRTAAEMPLCYCELPEDGSPACGEQCLNRCMYIECPLECPMGDRCSNKHFESPPEPPIKVAKCSGRGFGLEATSKIAKGSFIIEYRGEVINTSTSIDRMNNEYSNAMNHYFLNYSSNEVIDGYKRGTIARFANHSCAPNCHIEKWTVGGEFRIGLFATTDIEPGTEVTYDYRFESFGPLQKCLCQAENCRGYIGLNKKDDRDERKTKLKPLKALLSSRKPSVKLHEEEDDESKAGAYYWRLGEMPTLMTSRYIVKSARLKREHGRLLARNVRLVLEVPNVGEPKVVLPKARKSITQVVDLLHEKLDNEDLEPEVTTTISKLGSIRLGCLNPFKSAQMLVNGHTERPSHLLVRNLRCSPRLPFFKSSIKENVLSSRKRTLSEIVFGLQQRLTKTQSSPLSVIEANQRTMKGGKTRSINDVFPKLQNKENIA